MFTGMMTLWSNHLRNIIMCSPQDSFCDGGCYEESLATWLHHRSSYTAYVYKSRLCIGDWLIPFATNPCIASGRLASTALAASSVSNAANTQAPVPVN